jgi:hypothetical protein
MDDRTSHRIAAKVLRKLWCYAMLEGMSKTEEHLRDTGMNYLYYGDNLYILREHISDESVDLIICPFELILEVEGIVLGRMGDTMAL